MDGTYKASSRLQVVIQADSEAVNPRHDYEHLGSVLISHRRYKLSDKPDAIEGNLDEDDAADLPLILGGYDFDRDYTPYQEKEARHSALAKARREWVILPIYMYEHSGITISTGPYSCAFDSGQVGWIYCSIKKALEWMGRSLDSQGLEKSAKSVRKTNFKKKVEAVLRSEVAEYDYYLTGEVYGIISQKIRLNGEVMEDTCACWGFYPDADGSFYWALRSMLSLPHAREVAKQIGGATARSVNGVNRPNATRKEGK